MKQLTAAEHLAIAIDFRKEEERGGWEEALKELDAAIPIVRDMGAYLKVNASLRRGGEDIIKHIHDQGVKVFADLKIMDIEDTLAIDGRFLREFKPEILTVYAGVSINGMKRLKDALPDTEVVGVTVLTDCRSPQYLQSMHGTPLIENAIMRLTGRARDGGLDGVVISGAEAQLVSKYFPEMIINAVDIRPEGYASSSNDHQDRDCMRTPAQAITAGAHRIIIGRPITEAKNPRRAGNVILKEIASALAARV